MCHDQVAVLRKILIGALPRHRLVHSALDTALTEENRFTGLYLERADHRFITLAPATCCCHAVKLSLQTAEASTTGRAAPISILCRNVIRMQVTIDPILTLELPPAWPATGRACTVTDLYLHAAHLHHGMVSALSELSPAV